MRRPESGAVSGILTTSVIILIREILDSCLFLDWKPGRLRCSQRGCWVSAHFYYERVTCSLADDVDSIGMKTRLWKELSHDSSL